MATQTFRYASFGNDAVYCELDVNDRTWRPSQVRVVNTSASALKSTVLNAGTVVFEATAPAGQTTSWNISGVQLAWDAVDGGLILGPYGFGAQYPVGD